MIRKFSPSFDRILVHKAQPKKKVGAIVLPDTAQTKFHYGKVVEVGPGRRLDDGKFVPMSVKKGDVVMLTEWGGNKVNVNDQELYVVREDEILGVIEVDQLD
jgi:chaperonin GroES